METQNSPAINPVLIMQEKQKMAGDKYGDWLKNTPFPVERLSDIWKELAEIAKHKASPLNLRISLKEFVDVFGANVRKLSFFEFGCISNAIEVICFDDSGMWADKYIRAVKEAITHIEFYQQETAKIRKQIELDVEKEMSMKMAAQHTKDNYSGLKSINAQA